MPIVYSLAKLEETVRMDCSNDDGENVKDPESILTGQRLRQEYLQYAAQDGFRLIDAVEWAGSRTAPAVHDANLPPLAPRPKKERYADPCNCIDDGNTEACADDSCLLRACMEECRSNCPAGARCSNKRIQQARFAGHPLQIFDAGNKGRGLRITSAVRRGDFVLEYVGRAISARTLQQSLKQHYKSDQRLDIMALGPVYLDGRHAGGLSRYINHSRAPNCQVETWKVRGILRAVVVAMQDLPAGTELTFDYQWTVQPGRAPTKRHSQAKSFACSQRVPRTMPSSARKKMPNESGAAAVQENGGVKAIDVWKQKLLSCDNPAPSGCRLEWTHTECMPPVELEAKNDEKAKTKRQRRSSNTRKHIKSVDASSQIPAAISSITSPADSLNCSVIEYGAPTSAGRSYDFAKSFDCHFC
jgi:SET domain/AWS domain